MKKDNIELTEELTADSYKNFNPYFQYDGFDPNQLPNLTAPMDFRNSFSAQINGLNKGKFVFHCFQLLATIFLITSLTLTLVIMLGSEEEEDHTITIIIICILIYCIYLGMALENSSIKDYLNNLQKGDMLEIQYEENRAKKGKFRFTAECYHIERKEYIRTVKDRSGRPMRQKQIKEQKVVTFSATQQFTPTVCLDQSGMIDLFRPDRNIAFLSFDVQYQFKDQASKQIFDRQYKRFRQKNKRDKIQQYRYEYFVPNLKNNLSFYAGTLQCNLQRWYYIFVLIGLVWPFSVWMQFKIRRYGVKLTHQLTLK